MKILLCHNYYQQPGGEDQVFGDEGALLESRGHEVIRYTKHNDAIERMNRLALAGKTIWNRESAREIRQIVLRQRPDVMHCANTFPLISPSAYRQARKHGVAVVQTLHNYRTICPKAQFMRDAKVCESCLGKTFAWPSVVHKCYRDSRAASLAVATMIAFHRARGTWRREVDRFIALTEFSRAKHIDGGLPADKIDVKANFVDPDPGVGSRAGDYAVFVGRLSEEKGVQTLLAAWRQLRSDIPLKIVGDGPLAKEVQEVAAADSRIEWLGRRDLAQVCDIIGEAKCLVLPSVCYETFGRTIVEAYAKGTPVVVSQLGAMAELVDDGRTGLLFEAGNASDLANKVTQLVGEGSELAKFRQQARWEYESLYTAETNYDQLIQIYERAIDGVRAPTLVPANTNTVNQNAGVT